MTDVRTLSADRFELGEGGRWAGDTYLMVDIPAGHLFGTPSADPGVLTRLFELPVPLAAVTPVRDAPGTWLAAAGTGFWLLGPGGVRELAGAEPVTDREWRMNDGVCDPAGRFWVGSMACDQSPGHGALYRFDPDGRVHTVLRGLTIANGPAISADGRSMFLSDTPLGRIDRFDLDPATGELSGRRQFVQVAEGDGSPDGITLDAEGFLWVALFGGSAVRRYAPDGRLDRVVEVPAAQPTSVCLVGSRLLVTSGRGGLDQPGPADGAVMIGDAGVQGVEVLPTAFRP